MKRTIPAVILLVIVAALTVAGTLYTDHTFRTLEQELIIARENAAAGRYAQSEQALQAYEDEFLRRQDVLLLFVDRNLVLEARANGSVLLSYTNEDNVQDFLAELERTLQLLESIRSTQHRIL